MEIVVAWLVLSVLVAVLADARGRSGVGFFLMALSLSPLVAFVWVMVALGGKKCPAARKGSNARRGYVAIVGTVFHTRRWSPKLSISAAGGGLSGPSLSLWAHWRCWRSLRLCARQNLCDKVPDRKHNHRRLFQGQGVRPRSRPKRG
jgi:hypothetical protein